MHHEVSELNQVAAPSTSNATMDTQSVLFVCFANICRSPIAEAIFQHMVDNRSLGEQITRIESAGTVGGRPGALPDKRSRDVCKKHGVKIPEGSVCRKLQESDFEEFTYIIGMDNHNIRAIEQYIQSSFAEGQSDSFKENVRFRPPGSSATVALFGSFADGKQIIDPINGEKGQFEAVYQQCWTYSKALLHSMGFIEDENDRSSDKKPSFLKSILGHFSRTA